jgi:hypothetical protein
MWTLDRMGLAGMTSKTEGPCQAPSREDPITDGPAQGPWGQTAQPVSKQMVQDVPSVCRRRLIREMMGPQTDDGGLDGAPMAYPHDRLNRGIL